MGAGSWLIVFFFSADYMEKIATALHSDRFKLFQIVRTGSLRFIE